MSDVGRIALGCGNFGGIGSDPRFFGQGTSHDDAFALMDAAWAAGIRWFDTADAYGGGRSEAWIGEWIRSRRVRPKLTTKTFFPAEQGDPGGLSPERIARRIPISLERLGVDRIDVFLFHACDPDVPVGDSLDAVTNANEVGVSNFSAAELRPVARRVQWIQNSYSMLDRRDDKDVLPMCRAHGIRYQGFSPLAGGWLAGRYTRGREFPPDSRMAMRPEPYARFLREEVWDFLEGVRAFARARGMDMATWALTWALERVDSLVVGPRRVEHLTPVLKALSTEA
jgi:aryl-alcohol dehydrogenase-like predicted oxidoreductase